MSEQDRRNYQLLLQKIEAHARAIGRDPSSFRLVVVSKTHSIERILSLYEAGVRDFGENRVQEALLKIEQSPADIRWHLIGPLQKNKVRKALPYFSLFHSVDSLELAQKMHEVARETGKKPEILLQVNVSGEKTKHGLSPEEWEAQLPQVERLDALLIRGFMTMAPFVEEESVVRSTFCRLRWWRDSLWKKYSFTKSWGELSMGMSHDYLLAMEEGATLLRIGSAIFGDRETSREE